jgi:hypothetical protein
MDIGDLLEDLLDVGGGALAGYVAYAYFTPEEDQTPNGLWGSIAIGALGGVLFDWLFPEVQRR